MSGPDWLETFKERERQGRMLMANYTDVDLYAPYEEGNLVGAGPAGEDVYVALPVYEAARFFRSELGATAEHDQHARAQRLAESLHAILLAHEQTREAAEPLLDTMAEMFELAYPEMLLPHPRYGPETSEMIADPAWVEGFDTPARLVGLLHDEGLVLPEALCRSVDPPPGAEDAELALAELPWGPSSERRLEAAAERVIESDLEDLYVKEACDFLRALDELNRSIDDAETEIERLLDLEAYASRQKRKEAKRLRSAPEWFRIAAFEMAVGEFVMSLYGRAARWSSSASAARQRRMGSTRALTDPSRGAPLEDVMPSWKLAL